MGKKIIFGWDAEFDAKAQDAFAFVNSKRKEGERYPTINHWFVFEIGPFAVQGSHEYNILKNQGVSIEPIPERSLESTSLSQSDKKYLIVVGDQTYNFLRQTAASKNHLAIEQSKALGRSLGELPFASVAEYLQALLEDRVLNVVKEMNQEIILQETEMAVKELDAELAKEEAK